MSWGIVAAGALTIGSSMIQADAAGDASAVQAGAEREKIAEYRRQFDAVQKLLSPYTNTGVDALSESRKLLGLGGLPSGGISGGAGQSYDQIRNRLVGQFTTSAPGGIDRSRLTNIQGDPNSIMGAFDGNAENVANYGGTTGKERWWDEQTQSAWAVPQGWGGSQSSIDEQGLEAAIQAEMAGQGQQGAGDADAQQAAAVAKFENSPYFQAIVRQSEDAMLQNASATGGLRGGNTQDALSKNRPILLQQLIDKQLANLGGLASMGQNAAAGVGTAGMQTGQLIGSALGAGGAAQAGGILGQSNATIGALGNIGGMFGAKMAGTNPFGNLGGLQAKFSGTTLGSSGFGTGLAYGNQDLGAFL